MIDVSGSMEAGGRDAPLAKARRFAAQVMASGGAGDRYAIIAAGATPARLAGPCAPGPELDEALAHLTVERGAADVEAAIDLAAALVSREAAARVVLIGDGGETRAACSPCATCPSSTRPSRPLPATTSASPRSRTRPPDGARSEEEREAVVTVATSSDRPRVARVTVTADGQEIARRRLDVPARGEAEVRLRVIAAASRVVARVDPEDGGHRRARERRRGRDHGRRPPRGPRALDHDGRRRLQGGGVLRREGARRGRRAQGLPRGARSRGRRAGAGGHRRRPRGRSEAATGRPRDLPRHPHGRPALLGGCTRSWARGTHLRSLETGDPLLRGVALDGVTIEHATAVAAPPGARPLVDLDGGTVVLAGGAGRGRVRVRRRGSAKSDLVLRVAFPVLIANAVHALGGAVDVAVADTVARSEIALREAPREAAAGPVEPDARWRIGLSPVAFLAILGALLLSLEAWAWRKGWAS